MPIRPENRDRYPANWPEISRHIRFARALGRCECTGHCGTTHRNKDDDGRCSARHNGTNPRTGSKVVLTVAHLDHTPENCDETNLLALCQACHLAYDTDEHKATAARTRAAETATWNTPLPGLDAATVPQPRSSTGAIPSRGFMPRERDALDTALMRVPKNTDEEDRLARAFVDRRALACGWTADQRARVLDALFAEPRPLLAHHKRHALAAEAEQEQHP